MPEVVEAKIRYPCISTCPLKGAFDRGDRFTMILEHRTFGLPDLSECLME